MYKYCYDNTKPITENVSFSLYNKDVETFLYRDDIANNHSGINIPISNYINFTVKTMDITMCNVRLEGKKYELVCGGNTNVIYSGTIQYGKNLLEGNGYMPFGLLLYHLVELRIYDVPLNIYKSDDFVINFNFKLNKRQYLITQSYEDDEDVELKLITKSPLLEGFILSNININYFHTNPVEYICTGQPDFNYDFKFIYMYMSNYDSDEKINMILIINNWVSGNNEENLDFKFCSGMGCLCKHE